MNPHDPFDKSWSDGRLRAEFDTLQLYENGVQQVRTPRMFGDIPEAPLEPFTKAYPEYGPSNVQQFHAENRVINFDKIDILPEEP